MNKDLIQKIIKLHNDPCPDFNYDNPLLERKVAKALSKSVVTILSNSQENNINLKLKRCLLENVRKVCVNRADGHEEFDDHCVEPLLNCYSTSKYNENDKDEDTNKKLDMYFVNKFKDLHIRSNSKGNRTPEVVQAIINLNEENWQRDKLTTDAIISWDNNHKSNIVLQEIWLNADLTNYKLIDDIAIKFVPLIEKQLLCTCENILTSTRDNINVILSESSCKNLISKCAVSPNCFQIFSRILNHIFVLSNYNMNILEFIKHCIENVKIESENIALLYPHSLQSLVLMLNVELDEIPDNAKDIIVKPTLSLLRELRQNCLHDLLMLLTHYSQWFELMIKAESD